MKKGYPTTTEMTLPIVSFLMQQGGSATPREVQNHLAKLFNVDIELLQKSTPTGASQWGLEVNKARKELVKCGMIRGKDDKKRKWGIWELIVGKDENNIDYPALQEMIYPTVFFLASCGGYARQELIKQLLQEIFAIENKNKLNSHFDALRQKMVDDGYLLGASNNDGWELSLNGRIEFVKQMMFYKIYQDKMIDELN